MKNTATLTPILGRPQNNPIEFNTLQEQVLYATLLGDAFIMSKGKGSPNANSALQFEHSTKQQGYTIWKAEVLGMKTFHRDRFDPRTNKTYHSIVAYSKASPTYSSFYNRIYGLGGSKTLDQEILYSLNPIGLAVWIMDDGGLHSSGRQMILHTEGYSYQENVRMQKYFQDIWHLNPKVQEKKYDSGPKYLLSFNVEDTYDLVEIIKPYMLPELQYKVELKPYMVPPKWYLDRLKEAI